MPSAGKAVPHDSALGHVTGQAPYIDDLRPLAGELYVGYVGSPVAAGQLRGVDTSAALAITVRREGFFIKVQGRATTQTARPRSNNYY